MKSIDHFLSGDWGTSSFRIRVIKSASLEIIEEFKTDQGIASTYNEWLSSKRPVGERQPFYRKIIAGALSQLKQDVTNLPILLSGMASSTIGIQELPYGEFPFTWNVNDIPLHKIERDEFLNHPLYLVSGLKTESDIMRGEETILLGCKPDLRESVYIFPGTHSKHIFVIDAIATDFKTYMTGELFNVMSTYSVLKNSVARGESPDAFAQGVRDAKHKNLLHALFLVRSHYVLGKTSPAENYQYLSGLIIGTELKDLTSESGNVYLVGEGALIDSYRTALNILNVGDVSCVDATQSLIKGHSIIAASIA
jgi:2-dehydro-3-deoxygalactonokinase